MEWIETTGKTVEQAVDQALLELGIDEAELEYEVVQEPRSGILGIGTQRAHIRARVRPISREKPDRRRRRGRGKPDRGKPDRGKGRGRGRNGGRRPEAASRRPRSRDDDGEKRQQKNEERRMNDVPIDEQAEVAEDFTRGLVELFGLRAEVRARTEDERVQIEVEGDDLGILIGHDGATMNAMRELVKTALQRQTEGQNARVSIDVGGYGARRREALAEFVRRLAERAKETGRPQALEPMSPPDRKVVHDVVNEIDGVTTISEGDEPRRRVVVQPE